MVADIRCSTATLASWSGEALAVGLFSGEAGEASRGQLLERFGAAVADRLEQRRFKGKPGESLSIDLLGQTPSLLVLVGLGAPADFGPEQLRSATAAQTLQQGVAKLLGAAEGLEPARLAQELALLAVKNDVTEELDRLGAHIDAARALLADGGPVGRKFDFLMQEFMREANTSSTVVSFCNCASGFRAA